MKTISFLFTILFVASFTNSRAQDTLVRTDLSWVYSNNESPGWQESSFDDSKWAPVLNLGKSCKPSCFIGGDHNGNLGNLPYSAFLRKKFIVGNKAKALMNNAEDDDAEIYINGNLVFVDDNHTAGDYEGLDVTKYLIPNETNIIAVKQTDWFCCGYGMSLLIYSPPCNGFTVYADNDSDGYGDINKPLFVSDCIIPNGYVLDSSDCNDNNPAISPGTSEIPGDGIDNNCNGLVDENNALSFDGVDDYVEVPNESVFDFTNAMTVEAWVKIGSFTKTWQAIVTKGDDSWRLHRFSNSNTISFGTTGLSNGDLPGTANLNDGAWHHVAAVYDGAFKYVYVDGNLDGKTAVTGVLQNSNYDVAIGENLEARGREFNGKIDEVRIWKVARTRTQIQSDMNSGISGDTTGLVAYYPFNEGIADSNNTNIVTADDITANNNNGKLSNFALTGHKSNWVEGVPIRRLLDSLTLVDLYNSTNGANWTNKNNWLTANPVSTWYGITVSGTRVTTITLSGNQLSGHIPEDIDNLTALEELHLDSNQLKGPIPSSIGDLANLEVLNVTHNNLRDSIPSSLGNCSKLRIVRLSHNEFTGNIPSSFSNLKQLRIFNVGFNNLAGSVPVFLTALPKLRELGLMHNHYTFDGMEDLVQHDFDTLRYWNQKKIPVHQNGSILSVYAGGTLSNNTYIWYKDGTLAATISGDSTFTATAGGDYNVEVTNSIATALTLKSDTINVSALKGASAQNAIAAKGMDKNGYTVYPNPVRDVLHLDNLKPNSTISIITQDGRVVDKKIVSNSSYVWNVKNLAAGSYYVRIEEDKTVSVVMFVKQ
jgi:hypothetical protein